MQNYPEYINEDDPTINYTKVSFAMLGRLGKRLLRDLRDSGEIEDIRQAAGLSAYISFCNNDTVSECSRRAGRELYKTLTDLGYQKQGSFRKRDIPDSALFYGDED